MDSLVTTDWLADHLGEPDLVVLDASWHMPASGRDGRREFAAGHIPGARFFDIDALSDRAHPAPHMLPAASMFGAAMEALGVGRGDRIVVYDDSPLHSATRAWFMLRHFGAAQVAVLDGGLARWRDEGRPLATSEPPARDARFDAFHRAPDIVDKAELLGDHGFTLVDARGTARFEGSEADPRPGIAAGHIPGARNLPFGKLYEADGRLKPRDELDRLFSQAGVDGGAPLVASCGSGVTATSLILAAHLLGNDNARLYDGSWSEWGADPATPKQVGPAEPAGRA